MRTLDEAIGHCHEKAKEQRQNGCCDCADELEQLAEWLGELKTLRAMEEEPNNCGKCKNCVCRKNKVGVCRIHMLPVSTESKPCDCFQPGRPMT